MASKTVLGNLKSFLKQESFLSRVVTLVGGTALGQGVAILSMPWLTRLYLPEEMGRYGLFTSFVGTASVAGALLYEPAIVSAKNDHEAADLTALCCFLILSTTPCAAFLFGGLVHFDYLGFGSLPTSSIFFAAVCYFLMASFSILKYWLIRRGKFPLLGSISVFQNFVRSSSQLVFGCLAFNALGLLSGELLGRWAGIGRMLKQSKSELVAFGQPFSWLKLRRVALIYDKYPKYTLPSSVINVAATSLPIPMIVSLHGDTAGGYFVLAQRVLAIPLGLIGASVADVFHNQIADYASSDLNRAKDFFWKTFKKLLLIGLLLAIPLSMFSLWGFALFFGESWRISGMLLLAMLPWNISSLAVTPLSRVNFVFGGQRYKLVYDFFSLVSQLLVFWLANKNQLSLVHTVACMSVAGSMSYLVYLITLVKIIDTKIISTNA